MDAGRNCPNGQTAKNGNEDFAAVGSTLHNVVHLLGQKEYAGNAFRERNYLRLEAPKGRSGSQN